MPIRRYHPAPFSAPLSGDLNQRLDQIVAMINSLAATNVSPTYDYMTLTDEIGQTWAIYVQSNGQMRTEKVVPR